jgi:DNA-binding response OmpR family regulator
VLADQADRRDTAPFKQSGLTVLSVSGLEEDHVALEHLFSHSNWRLHSTRNLGEACEALRTETISVAICERDLPDGTWKNLLAELAVCDPPPVLVVSSRIADDYLWAEVLNLGGCDVLAKPFDSKEVVWVVSMAWNDWKNRSRQSLGALV